MKFIYIYLFIHYLHFEQPRPDCLQENVLGTCYPLYSELLVGFGLHVCIITKYIFI